MSTEFGPSRSEVVCLDVLVKCLLLLKISNVKALIEAPLPLLAPLLAKFNGQILINLLLQELESVPFNVVQNILDIPVFHFLNNLKFNVNVNGFGRSMDV